MNIDQEVQELKAKIARLEELQALRKRVADLEAEVRKPIVLKEYVPYPYPVYPPVQPAIWPYGVTRPYPYTITVGDIVPITQTIISTTTCDLLPT